jgi:hypothetical protein
MLQYCAFWLVGHITSLTTFNVFSDSKDYQLCSTQHVVVMASRANGLVDNICFLERIGLHHH